MVGTHRERRVHEVLRQHIRKASGKRLTKIQRRVSGDMTELDASSIRPIMTDFGETLLHKDKIFLDASRQVLKKLIEKVYLVVRTSERD